ncbi:MAG: bifunctional precorrin-2 dehydrogenase/sirohydrochlorin ferrochelatase [Lachnospiraceae bacterium]|nr:bifunctional precorrin-2 dehydrogenase/sirohydrochlorin ferrochelatase [Lachnospiraceae bacterium]
MSYFPMMVKLDGKKVLIIGGGVEGLKKTRILHDFGAEICLISKDALKEAAELASRYEEREFRDTDITDEHDLIVAATDDRELNKRISRLARDKRIPVNVVDDEELCSFIFPAIVKDKDVVCAVSSGGKSPYITQYIKALLSKLLPENIGEINDRMGEYRKQAKKELKEAIDRRSFLKKKLEEELGTDIGLS